MYIYPNYLIILEVLCLIMVNFIILGNYGKIHTTRDGKEHWDVRCYDNAYTAVKYMGIPTAMN